MTLQIRDRSDDVGRDAERTLLDAMHVLESARRCREEFLSRMSHELRTPLNAVIGFSRVLESNRAGNQRPEDIEMLRRVRAGGEQLLRLVEDVLEQSRIARGNLMLATSPVDVRSIVRQAVRAHLPAARARGLVLEERLPARAAAVPLDAERFRRVLDCLIDNAIKFTDRGTVSVQLVADVDDRPACLTVTDTGVGIPMERLEEIFEPFEQVDTSRARAHGGAGLGLPIARFLCHAMGCRLTVDSALGRGSRFTVGFDDEP